MRDLPIVRAGNHFDLGIPAPVVRELTGIGPDRFGQLVIDLEPKWLALQRGDLAARRPSRRRKPGGGRPPLPFAMKLMAALIQMRWAPSLRETAALPGISKTSVQRAAGDLRGLLLDNGVEDERRLRAAAPQFAERAAGLSARDRGNLALRLSSAFVRT